MAHTHLAIIGDGPASLILLSVLRYAGVPRGTVAIYGDSPHPMAKFQRYASAVNQQTMRSEGDGHLHPRNFPDLTWKDAWENHTLRPFFLNLFNLYNPPLKLLLKHATEVAEEFEFEAHHTKVRVECVKRPRSGAGHFDLLNPEGQSVGRARHAVLAMGHPGLNWPAAFAKWRDDPRVTHVYEQATVAPGERVVIVGGGIAATHGWLAALDAGAEVVALHMEPLFQQPLNAPRCAFNETGFRTYRQLTPDERVAKLRGAMGSSYPKRRHWEEQLTEAKKAGRFRTQQTTIREIEGIPNSAGPLMLWLNDRTAMEADRLILATGFNADPRTHPVIANLVAEESVSLYGGFLRPNDDFTLPPISQPNSILAVMGTLARFALPVADTFVGMKYVSRRLVPLLKP